MKPFLSGQRLSYYDYYSFERVGVFYGIKTINGVDWHKEMSEHIIKQQNLCGEFEVSKAEQHHARDYLYCPQAFALLFLKKATKKLYR